MKQGITYKEISKQGILLKDIWGILQRYLPFRYLGVFIQLSKFHFGAIREISYPQSLETFAKITKLCETLYQYPKENIISATNGDTIDMIVPIIPGISPLEVENTLYAISVANGYILPTHIKHNRAKDINNQALILGAQYGQSDYVDMLLGSKNSTLCTGAALPCAAENGHLKIVISLLKHPKSITSDNYAQAFLYALEHAHIQILELLLESVLKYCDDKQQIFVFLKVAAYGHMAIVQLLYEKIQKTISDHNLIVALSNACENGHPDVVEFLLYKTQNIPLFHKNLLILNPAKRGHIAVVELLLTYFSNIDFSYKKRAFNYAVEYGHLEIVQLFLDTVPEISNVDIALALVKSTENHQEEVSKYLSRKVEKALQIAESAGQTEEVINIKKALSSSPTLIFVFNDKKASDNTEKMDVENGKKFPQKKERCIMM